MKPFEVTYLAWEPFVHPLAGLVRQRLRSLLRENTGNGARRELLDVGGRKSHYTIGVPADVTISDLPRETDVQHQLNLGINDAIIEQTKARRHNIKKIVYDDMTQTKLPESAYDGVLAIEVMEHVEDYDAFVHNVARVLRPGGFFLLTTPNGDSLDMAKINNADNKQFFTKESLREVLAPHFDEIEIEYAVPFTKAYLAGKKKRTIKRPFTLLCALVCGIVHNYESRREEVKDQAKGTNHLFAVARKSKSNVL